MKKLLGRLAREEKGATAIEYGLIAALIAVPIIMWLPGIGEKLADAFKTIDQALTSGAPSGGAGGGN